ncbi:MAG: EF-P beta-lysylation protein EpmB [Pirellulales bacterium]
MAIVTSSRRPVLRTGSQPTGGRWQEAMRDAVRDADELCGLLELPESVAEEARLAGGSFPLFVPRGYIARMRVGDLHDPLLRQVLPLGAERIERPGDVADPVGDLQAAVGPALIQKYQGRILVVATGACAVHCRYCFRRLYPYSGAAHTLSDVDRLLKPVAADTGLHEVILSGGDPLTLSDEILARLVRSLASIGHVRRLRIHTRLPIMIPQRVTDAMLDWLGGTRLIPVVVLHANHAAELDAEVAVAVARLTDAGAMVLNQAVLLRGVNDQIDALAALCERLIEIRVTPYYLHQLDRVRGASHFEVPVRQGLALIASLRARLPGYAVPRYVREIPGRDCKGVLA